MTTNELIDKIGKAFASVKAPPKWALVDSFEGDEPGLIAEKLTGLPPWESLTGEFLDNLGAALSFFSAEAFRYYLPAFLVTCARRQTKSSNADPLFCLTCGLDNASAREKINPKRYGERTWEDHARYRFSIFNREQAQTIVSYLEFELASQERSDYEKTGVQEALDRYWRGRAQREG